MIPRRRTRFPHRLWYWTHAHENLFDLSHAERFIFRVLIDEVLRTEVAA